MARTLADAILRRLDLGTAGPPPPAEVAEVAQVLGLELGWDAGRARAEREALARFYEDAYNGTRIP
jgi:glycerol-3-phosphate dehydrogenase